MLPEKVKNRSRKQPHRQKRDHKARRIHTDQQIAERRGRRRRYHQKHTGQRRSHTGRPRKAESEPEHQRHQRIHGKFVQPEMNPVLFIRRLQMSENSRLVNTEQNHQNTADPRKHRPVS